MSQIKFRAYDKKEKKMIVGESLEDMMNHKLTNFLGYWCWDERLEIMQFTGLLDKNGKEIYEGDILEWKYNKLLEVRWGKVGWVLFGDLFKGSNCKEHNTLGYIVNSEIIGNIYENKDLL